MLPEVRISAAASPVRLHSEEEDRGSLHLKLSSGAGRICTDALSAAVGLRSLGHGLHRLPDPVPGGLGPVYLYKLSRTSETSDGERGGEPAAQ